MRALILLLAATALQISAQGFPSGAKLEKLFEGGHLTEGAAVAPDGSVYFSDITFTTETGMQAGHIMRYDPVTRKTSVFRSPSGMANGIKFDAQGRMVVAEGADYGGRRITRTDLANRQKRDPRRTFSRQAIQLPERHCHRSTRTSLFQRPQVFRA